MPGRRLLLSLIAVSLTTSGAAAYSQTMATGAMLGIFDSLLVLLPHSLDAERFADPANRTEILAALVVLADNASAIEQHGAGLDASYDRARETMAQDTREALEAYEVGEYHSARFLVRNLTENCFDCHSRGPGEAREVIARRFSLAIDLNMIPLEERLQLLVATRQFETAQQLAENLMADPSLDPAEIDLMGTFEDYLKLCIRVKGDFERPRVALNRLLERDDLPLYLDLQVNEWSQALADVAALEVVEPLRAARELLSEARRRNLYLRDRRGLVHAVRASGLLHEFVRSDPDDALERAEAYYLLGLAEASISRTIWVPETEFFLEMAIRTAPHTEPARDAYAFLEQFTLANYTGSGGLDVPEGIWTRLMELRDLAEPR